MPNLRARQSFTVPAGADQYAPETIFFGSLVDDLLAPALLGVSALLESAPAGATVELWLPKLTGDAPTIPTDFVLSGFSLTGGAETWPLASWPGALIRVKSGGTAGTATVSASADY